MVWVIWSIIVWLDTDLDQELLDPWKKFAVRIAVLVFVGGGLLALGRKLSGKVMSPDDHLRVGCGLEPDGQVSAQVVADSSLIAPHARSAKTQTLENKAFPVTDRHDSSQAFCAWA
jgi:hypothetical protein